MSLQHDTDCQETYSDRYRRATPLPVRLTNRAAREAITECEMSDWTRAETAALVKTQRLDQRRSPTLPYYVAMLTVADAAEIIARRPLTTD